MIMICLWKKEEKKIFFKFKESKDTEKEEKEQQKLIEKINMEEKRIRI